MFNDKYGLTQAVLEGHKTMTRRFVPDGTPLGSWKETVKRSHYQIGEEIAIAQRYKDFLLFNHAVYEKGKQRTAGMTKGWTNKMFVSAEYMPHRIRITDINVERLQDISEEDCLKEGIQEFFPYIDRNPNDRVRTFQYFMDGNVRHRMSPAPECFALLIDDICGKGTWESNPFVFVYKFELEK